MLCDLVKLGLARFLKVYIIYRYILEGLDIAYSLLLNNGVLYIHRNHPSGNFFSEEVRGRKLDDFHLTTGN